MSFGSRLKERRESMGLTQVQLAERLGVTKGAIGNYETDANSPKASILYKVFEVLQCDANYLFQDEIKERREYNATAQEMDTLVKRYRALDEHGKKMVDFALDEETARMQAESARDEKPARKVIPLFDNPAAAGTGSPSFSDGDTNYEVDAESPADFAFKVQGDSMEPYLPDGSIALAVRGQIDNGDVGVFVLDGEMFCKQFCMDHLGNIYLFSLNRARRDADQTIWHDSNRGLYYVGKVLTGKRLPLPND